MCESKNLLTVTHDNSKNITYRNGVAVKSEIKMSKYSYCAKLTLYPHICCSNRTYHSLKYALFEYFLSVPFFADARSEIAER